MNVEVERYGIYLASLDPTCGAEISKMQPVAVVNQNEMSRHLETVIVCLLNTKRHLRCRSRVQCAYAGRKVGIAVEQIRTVGKAPQPVRRPSRSRAGGPPAPAYHRDVRCPFLQARA